MFIVSVKSWVHASRIGCVSCVGRVGLAILLVVLCCATSFAVVVGHVGCVDVGHVGNVGSLLCAFVSGFGVHIVEVFLQVWHFRVFEEV